MNCLGFLGDVLHSCLHCCTDGHSPSKKSRFYVPPTKDPRFCDDNDDDGVDSDNGDRHNTYASARNKAVRFLSHNRNWDVVPKSCPSGHWTMRYSTPTRTNFTPWTRESPFGPFDLVPWRKQGSRLDLVEAVGWDCNKQPPQRTTRRAIRRSTSYRRRLIRIRVVFSFEFHKRMRLNQHQPHLLQQRSSRLLRHHRSSRVRLAGRSWVLTSNQRQVFLFDPKVFRLSADWLGYFSQRPSGVDELLNRGFPSKTLPSASRPDRMDYRTLFGKVSQLFFKDNAERQVFKQVPCAGCRKRYCVDNYCTVLS